MCFTELILFGYRLEHYFCDKELPEWRNVEYLSLVFILSCDGCSDSAKVKKIHELQSNEWKVVLGLTGQTRTTNWKVLSSSGSIGRMEGKKHEIFAAAFGGHVFYDLFL